MPTDHCVIYVALEPNDAIKKVYDPDFRLKYTVKVGRAGLFDRQSKTAASRLTPNLFAAHSR